MVFDAVVSSFSANITKRALLSRAPQGSAALESALEDEAGTDGGWGRRASDREKALRKEAAAPVLQALEKVIDSRGGELSQICRHGFFMPSSYCHRRLCTHAISVLATQESFTCSPLPE